MASTPGQGCRPEHWRGTPPFSTQWASRLQRTQGCIPQAPISHQGRGSGQAQPPWGDRWGCEGPEGWCLLALALLTSCSPLKPSARAFKHTQSIFSDSPAPPGAPPPLPGRRAVTSRAARRLAAPSCHPSLHSTGPPPSSLLGTGAGAQTPGPGLHSCLTESEQPEESRRAGPRHVHSRAPFYRLQAFFINPTLCTRLSSHYFAKRPLKP